MVEKINRERDQEIINDLKDVLKTWEDYKIRFPIEKIPNRL